MPPVTRGYSLWLMPETSSARSLARCIDLLADSFQSPRFLPHITLLGEAVKDKKQILEGASVLAGFLPFHLTVTSPAFSTSYFRALSLEVAPERSLNKARRLACRLYGRHAGPYRPHISLLYGKMPKPDKSKAFDRLGLVLPAAVTVRELAVVRTEGNVSRWRRVAVFRG